MWQTGRDLQSLLVGLPSVSPCFWGISKNLFMARLLSLLVNCLLPLWNPRPFPPPPLSRMAYKPQLPSVSLGIIFLWHPHTCIQNDFRCFLLFCLLLLWLLAQPEGLRKVWGELLVVPHRAFHKGMARIPKAAGAKLIGQIVMFCACLRKIFNKWLLCEKEMFYLRLDKHHLPGVFLQETCYQEVLEAVQDQIGSGQFPPVPCRDLGSLTCPKTFES